MTLVKICGITNLNDAFVAAESGADMLGFNFYENSPRYITPDSARKIIDELNGRVRSVGIFVNMSIDELADIAAEANIDAIQLHGDEPADFVREAGKQSLLEIIKAFRISDESSARAIGEYNVDGILLDGRSADLYGGSGTRVDWQLAGQIATKYPNVYLAGGLDPGNVRTAIRTVRPYAVDVASGVESASGRKDAKLIEEFIRNVKNA